MKRKTCLECKAKLRRTDPLGRGPGYNGNGIFCTLRCGFNWAVRQAWEEAL